MFVIVKLQDVSNFAGLDGFCWFVGQVEARVLTYDAGTRTVTRSVYDEDSELIGTEQVQVSDGATTIPDPLRLGRVKVRCIGYHTQDRNQLPTEDLPWATVLHPITSPGISGVGTNPNLLEGTTVFGFFIDAHDKQHPVILGCFAGRDAPGASTDYRVSLLPIDDVDSIPEVVGEDIEDCLYNKGIYGPYDPNTQSWPGMKEHPGGKNATTHNGRLRSMFNQIGFKGRTGEGTHWCAAFVTHALQCAGMVPLKGNRLGARAYENYPGEVIWDGTGEIPYDKLNKNDIMVFERPGIGTGHVGFYHSTNNGKIKLTNGNAGRGQLKIDRNGRNPNRTGRKLLKVIRPVKA